MNRRPFLPFLIAAVALFLILLLGAKAEARPVFGKVLPNGAIITLTDEPCDLKNPLDGKLLTGNKAFGAYAGVTHLACWKYGEGTVFIIWFESDGTTPSGVVTYDAESFKRLANIGFH